MDHQELELEFEWNCNRFHRWISKSRLHFLYVCRQICYICNVILHQIVDQLIDANIARTPTILNFGHNKCDQDVESKYLLVYQSTPGIDYLFFVRQHKDRIWHMWRQSNIYLRVFSQFYQCRYFILQLPIHLGRMMPICVGQLVIIGSYNGLRPNLCQAVIWTNCIFLMDSQEKHSVK